MSNLLSQFKQRISKSMPDKTILPDEINNLKIRQMILNNKQTELGIIRNEYQNYLSLLLKNHGGEDGKEYEINLESGKIEEKIKIETKQDFKLKEIKK